MRKRSARSDTKQVTTKERIIIMHACQHMCKLYGRVNKKRVIIMSNECFGLGAWRWSKHLPAAQAAKTTRRQIHTWSKHCCNASDVDAPTSEASLRNACVNQHKEEGVQLTNCAHSSGLRRPSGENVPCPKYNAMTRTARSRPKEGRSVRAKGNTNNTSE